MKNLTIQELLQKISDSNKALDLLERIKAFKYNPIDNIDALISDIKCKVFEVAEEIDSRHEILTPDDIIIALICPEKE